MFFIAVEIRDNPSLADKPCAVGGESMLSTANYIARKFGVRSAMPGFIARKLCPELIIVPGSYHKYQDVSKIFKDILYEYDPDLASMGLDEANLDITQYLEDNNIRIDQEIQDLCYNIRMKINDATQLTCSCGIAPNRMLAKICSDMNKPNGQFFLEKDTQKIKEFMSKLSVRKIPGIGNVSEQLLQGLDVSTCQDLIDRRYELKLVFNDSSFDFFLNAALGIGRIHHEQQEDQKSISVSRTFPIISDKKEMIIKLQELAEKLEKDVQMEQKLGKLLTLTFKSHKFETKTRQMQLDRYIETRQDIHKYALQIFHKFEDQIEPVRLLGIKLGDLIDKATYSKNTILKYFKSSKPKGDNLNNQNGNIQIEKMQEDNKLDENKDENLQQCIKDEDDDDSMSSVLQIINQQQKLKIKSPCNMDIDVKCHKTENEKEIQIKQSIPEEPLNQNNRDENQKVSTESIQKFFNCPICEREIECNYNNARMNNHITKCIQALESKQSQETDQNQQQTTQNLTQNSGPDKKRKPTGNDKSQKPDKKPKQINKPKIQNTNRIENYFKK